jgi:TRAP-type uncharacterized transport system fused permease subunit
MSFNSNRTFSLYSKMEGEVISLSLIGYVCNLPIEKEEEINKLTKPLSWLEILLQNLSAHPFIFYFQVMSNKE